MKKLLLFISMLFVFSLAYSGNIIVSPNGEILENCGNNHYAYPGNCPRNNDYYSPNIHYYGGIAVDVETGNWGRTYNYTNKGQAKNDAIARCGSENCKYVGVKNFGCTSAVYSKTEKILTYETLTDGIFGNGGLLFGNGSPSETKSKATEKAMKKCEKKGGKNCEVLTTVCGLDN